MSYTKLFGSIVHSTIWREPDHVRIVWVTMLAMCDQDGVVEASVPGLADVSRVSLEQCKQALSVLMAPDEYSRSPAHEGRRIEAISGGWRLINYDEYRKKLDQDEVRSKAAARQARYRARLKAEVTPCHAVSRDVPKNNDIAEAKAEANKEREAPSAQSPQSKSSRATRLSADWTPSDKLQAWAKGERPELDHTKELAAFCDYWKAKAGRDGLKLDWDATYRNWIRNARGTRVVARPEPQELPDL